MQCVLQLDRQVAGPSAIALTFATEWGIRWPVGDECTTTSLNSGRLYLPVKAEGPDLLGCEGYYITVHATTHAQVLAEVRHGVVPVNG